MNNRPWYFRGEIHIKSEYLIGKVIKNSNVENKERFIQILDDENLEFYEEGYRGYIFQSMPTNIDLSNIDYCYNIPYSDTLINYDVIEIVGNENIRLLYRDDSDDNAIVVTNQCNSNCIMCPDADEVRNTKITPDLNVLLEHIRCIPNDTKHLTITGGEPGLLKEDLILLLEECKNCLPNTEFLLLTNGRVFSDEDFTRKISKAMPNNIRIGIPIYADNEVLHDEITQVPGSFKQTICGIKRLMENKVDIEVRIVVQKKNYQYLEKIAKFIACEIPDVKMVNIMALEMSGSAYRNKEDIWVNFELVKEYLYRACVIMLSSGIIVNLYNFPLCMINEKLYSIANKSITDYKIKYKPECDLCMAKENCGGFFSTTINLKEIKVKPIQ